jgi:hypothetical protein
MSNDKKQNFVQVNYDLLATKKLNSTQKLFISYIIGWQKNKLICKETNNNLATKFGMTYSGIRTVLNELNKHDFFNSLQKDYNEENGTSGHEIRVNEAKLKLFLNVEKEPKENISTELETENNIMVDEEIDIDSKGDESILKYRDSDIINISQVMTYLGFNNEAINTLIKKFKSETVIFESFATHFCGLNIGQKRIGFDGIIISAEQFEKFSTMVLD